MATKVIYPASPLSRRSLLRAELNDNIAAMAAAYATKLTPENFRPATIEHRHSSQPLRVPLETDFFSSPLDPHVLNVGWINDAGTFNYYLIDNSILKLTVPHDELANISDEHSPVFNVKALYRQVDSGITNLITRVTIGVSLDDGATWTPKELCSRPCGMSAGSAPAVYAGTQSHYLTGAAVDVPDVMDRAVVLVASFGGRHKTSISEGGVKVAVMANSFDTGDNGSLRGRIELNARWVTESMV